MARLEILQRVRNLRDHSLVSGLAESARTVPFAQGDDAEGERNGTQHRRALVGVDLDPVQLGRAAADVEDQRVRRIGGEQGGAAVEGEARLLGRGNDLQANAGGMPGALEELAGHYHFAPRPCTPGRANEKGKVERQILYLRQAFFAARTFVDVADLNAQFGRWRDEVAHRRVHPEHRDRTVADVLAEEQPRLLPLPAHPFATEVMRIVSARKTPYVRFDRNSYSIPHPYRQRPLTLLASPTTVRVLAGTEEIACHARSYDTGRVVEDEAHVRGLIAATRQTNPSSARDRLRLAVPIVATLLERLATRGESLRVHVARLLSLLDDYGPQELTAAIDRALERDALGAGAIAHILETRRRQRGLKPPMPMALPDRPGVRELDVTPHRLETYDALTRLDPDDAA